MQGNLLLNRITLSFILVFFTTLAIGQQSTVLDIAEEELKREFEILSKAEPAAYYMDYRIDDFYRFNTSADMGNLLSVDSSQIRIGSARVRVGSYEFDNTFENDDNLGYFSRRSSNVSSSYMPIENAAKPMKLGLWSLTQEAYENAAEIYEDLQTTEIDTADDHIANFSREEPSEHLEEKEVEDLFVDKEAWVERVKRLSSEFKGKDSIVYGSVNASMFMKRGHFVSSEGSRVVETLPYAYVFIYAGMTAEDNSVVRLSKSYFAFSADKLPSEEEMRKDIEQLLVDLKALSKAPLASPYTGPALLHPRVAGVFFHEIFGHRIEGHRLRSETDGQTFKERINEKVLPEGISVISDPTMSEFAGRDLNGYYTFDDEGIEAQRVAIVEDGILKSFLMSRTPLDTLITSNGHGRAQAGYAPVSRQSNLLVESEREVPEAELRALLIEECKRQEKEFGYYFKDVEGGFTETSRYQTNAFNIKPTLVYRVYVDGRPDELVRGVDLIGTPLAMFAEIYKTSDTKDTFIGFCGAESGSVPVSATSPGLLVRRIETQKKPVETEFKEKILPNPATAVE